MGPSWFLYLYSFRNESQMNKTFAFWAAAPKGRCPVGHRGEFPYVRPYVPPPPKLLKPLRPQIWPLRPQIQPLRPQIQPLRPQI